MYLLAGVLAVLAALGLLALLRHPHAPRRHGEGPQLTWLMTADGERRGLLLRSDLRRDADDWELWGPAAGRSPLAPLTQLVPRLQERPGFAFNGGYWNEHEHPVGVCAGTEGIMNSVSHGAGAALAGGRLWIGPMTSRIELARTDDEPSSQRLKLNPRPLPRRSACLIDPRTYPWPLAPEAPCLFAWLTPDERGPLRYNTTRAYTLGRKGRAPGGGVPLEQPPAGTLLWMMPPDSVAAQPNAAPRPADTEHAPADALDDEEETYAPPTRRGRELPPLHTPLRLKLELTTVQGEVEWVTCAGPRLLREGKPVEGLDARRTTRTVLGTDRAGSQLLVLLLARGADGQDGATLEEAARELLSGGAHEAINLDGGSSTSVWISGEPGKQAEILFPARWPIHHALVLRRQAM